MLPRCGDLPTAGRVGTRDMEMGGGGAPHGVRNQDMGTLMHKTAVLEKPGLCHTLLYPEGSAQPYKYEYARDRIE